MATSQFGRLAHCSAAINGHLDVVKYLLEECPRPIDINAIDEVRTCSVSFPQSVWCRFAIANFCVQRGSTVARASIGRHPKDARKSFSTFA